MKFCKGCIFFRFHSIPGSIPKCAHPLAQLPPEPVLGIFELKTCQFMRSEDGPCTIEAKLYEAIK